MAAISGNVWTLAVGKQTAKGTPQATPTYKLKATGGDIAPSRGTIQLAETDASRQQGQTVVVEAHVEGSPEHYVRPSDFGLLAYGLLGANADSGTGPNYTHTATPANSGPYFTLFKAIGGSVLVDQYIDCRVTGLTLRGGAGQALTCSVTWYGLNATFGATDPVLAVVTEAPFVYPEVTVTKGGSAPGTVESFELTIANNGVALHGDKQINPYEYVWGELAVSGSITYLFQTDADYRSFHTGTSSGTAFSTTLFTESLSIKAAKSVNLSVEAVLAGVAYTAYPVPGSPGGDPIRVAATFNSQPQTAIADYISLITKNTVATY
jgi:hypothetical protein